MRAKLRIRVPELARRLLCSMAMRLRVLTLVVLVSFSAACTTTTAVGSFSDGAAQRWLAEKASSDMTVETNDSPPGLGDVRIEAISPTDVRFHASSGQVVPTDRIRRVTVRNHWLGGIEGMLAGAGIGIAAGVLLALVAGPGNGGPDCDTCRSQSETAVLGAVLFGVPALVGGLIGGAVKGHQEVLELK